MGRNFSGSSDYCVLNKCAGGRAAAESDDFPRIVIFNITNKSMLNLKSRFSIIESEHYTLSMVKLVLDQVPSRNEGFRSLRLPLLNLDARRILPQADN